NCQRVKEVSRPSTVREAATSCQPNQTTGKIHNHRVAGHRVRFATISNAPATAKGSNAQKHQRGGHAYATNSEDELGAGIRSSRITGLPSLISARPRNNPKISARISRQKNHRERPAIGAVCAGAPRLPGPAATLFWSDFIRGGSPRLKTEFQEPDLQRE